MTKAKNVQSEGLYICTCTASLARTHVSREACFSHFPSSERCNIPLNVPHSVRPAVHVQMYSLMSTSIFAYPNGALMPDLIPAAPGWYVESRIVGAIDPVIAWKPTTDAEDREVLLPYVPDNYGFAPTLIDPKSFEEHGWRVVYLPNHDPATDA